MMRREELIDSALQNTPIASYLTKTRLLRQVSCIFMSVSKEGQCIIQKFTIKHPAAEVSFFWIESGKEPKRTPVLTKQKHETDSRGAAKVPKMTIFDYRISKKTQWTKLYLAVGKWVSRWQGGQTVNTQWFKHRKNSRHISRHWTRKTLWLTFKCNCSDLRGLGVRTGVFWEDEGW